MAEDIREVLIQRINLCFSLTDVESLLAYKIILFMLLEAHPKSLYRKSHIIIEYASTEEFGIYFNAFEGRDEPRIDSSLTTAFKSGIKSTVLNKVVDRPNKEFIEGLSLENRQYLNLLLEVKHLKEGIFYGEKIRYDAIRHGFFDQYCIPYIKKLNCIAIESKLSLRAYQIALYLIFSLTEENIKKDETCLIFESYEVFSSYVSNFVDVIDVPVSTISDNLDQLHNAKFAHVSFVNFRCEYDGSGGKFSDYRDREHLQINLLSLS